MMGTRTTDHAVYATPLKDDVRYLLKTLLETHHATRLLEIGTGLGLTSAWLAQGLPELSIDTVEKSEDAAQKSYQLFASLGLLDRVHVYHENAHQFYPVKPYDAILLDASKSQQKALVERFFPVLKPTGFMLIDNLALGRVKNAAATHSRDALKNKHEAFVTWLSDYPDWTLKRYAIGDGVAVITPVSKPYA